MSDPRTTRQANLLGVFTDVPATPVAPVAPTTWYQDLGAAGVCLFSAAYKILGGGASGFGGWSSKLLGSLWNPALSAVLTVALLGVTAGQPISCNIFHPKPTPPAPVTPTDPFLTTLQAAWAQETDANKVAEVQQLAAIYEQAGTITINDPTIKTVGDFWTAFEKAVTTLIPSTAIPKVRTALGVELSKTLPSSTSATLDATTRSSIGTAYQRIAKDLETLK